MLLNCIVLGAITLFFSTRQISTMWSMKTMTRISETDKALSDGLSHLYSLERSRCQ